MTAVFCRPKTVEVTMSTNYHEMAKTLKFPTNAFIGGKFVPAMSGKTLDTYNPATGEKLASYASCGKEDVNEAVKIARNVFNSGVWSKMHPTERKKILLNFAHLVEKNMTELSLLESLDSGKPINECMTIDLPETVHCLEWHAEYADKRYDSLSPSGSGAVGLVVREAIGVVGCVLPWNFPLMTAAWKIAPALAEGNSVIVKAASVTTLSMLRLAELGAEAGIPEGVMQVIPGPGGLVGEALGMHEDVDIISFTGSTEIGRQFLQYSAQSNLKKIVLELGGKNPFVLLQDVEDISAAVENALSAAFWNTGQNCTANSRIIVPNKHRDAFIEQMVAGLKDWPIGDPLDPVNRLGSMVSQAQFDTVMGFIKKGKEEATLVTGGEPLAIGSGLFIPPTIFKDAGPDATIVREEIFGPVTCVIGVDSDEEALAIANDTCYGLQASLFTNDVTKAHQFARALQAGTVSVNAYCEGDISTPFGGYKLSGFGGRDNAVHAHDQYLETKSIFISLG